MRVVFNFIYMATLSSRCLKKKRRALCSSCSTVEHVNMLPQQSSFVQSASTCCHVQLTQKAFCKAIICIYCLEFTAQAKAYCEVIAHTLRMDRSRSMQAERQIKVLKHMYQQICLLHRDIVRNATQYAMLFFTRAH